MEHLFKIDNDRKSATEVVIDKITSLLIEKKIGPGDLIPSENVLAENLGVSRGSIREAMKILSAFGVIDIKRGAGTYISNGSNKKLFNPLLFRILVCGSDMSDLVEIRELMEKGIITLILEHATDAGLEQLDAEMKKFSSFMAVTPPDYESGNTADLAYHRLMGELTGNAIVSNIYSFVINLFAPTIDSRAGYKAHAAMHERIMARDERGAIEMLHEHTKVWNEIHKTHVQEDMLEEIIEFAK